MRVFICLLLIRIFAYSHSIQQIIHKKPAENQRSVNLALETVLEFNNKDNSGDVKILDNIQKFISKVKTVIDKKKNLRRDFRTPKIVSFTDFIQEVVAILNNYEDDALRDFFVILDQEIRKYHYRGCKFYELTENYELRKFLDSKLDMLKGQPTFIIKAYINIISKVLKDRNYEKDVKELVDYINSVYRHDAKEKFRKVLNELDNYGQSKSKNTEMNLVEIVKDGLRSIIFDHYTDLNPNARRELKNKIESFWKQYHETSIGRSKNDENNNFEIDVIPDFKDDTVKKMVAMPSTYKKEDYKKHDKIKSDNKRIDIKVSDYKKGIMRDGLKEDKKPKSIKYTKIDTADDFTTKTEVTTTSKVDKASQSTTPEINHRIARTSSSDEGDFTGESFEGNSIEYSQEQKRIANTQRYMTLYPEAITVEPKTTAVTATPSTTTADPKSIVHRSVQLLSFKPHFQTLWVEESTGAVPKYILNRYTTKLSHKHKTTRGKKHGHKHELRNQPKHESRNDSLHKTKHDKKQHGSKHGKSKHKSKHGTKHKSKHSQKQKHHKKKLREKPDDKKHTSHHPKHRKPLLSKLLPKHKNDDVLSQGHGFIGVATAMELYEYKKMMEPISINTSFSSRPTTTTEFPITKPSITMIPVKPPTRLGKLKKFTKIPENPLLKRASASHNPNPLSGPLRSAKQTKPSTESTTTNKKKVAHIEKYAKRYELLVGKQHRDLRKSIAPPLPNERNSLETFEKERKQKKFYRKPLSKAYTNKKTTVPLDFNVVRRLKNLEIALNEVQNKINEVTYIAQLEKEVTETIGINEKKWHQTFDTKVKKGKTLKPNDLKVRKNRFRLTGASDKEMEQNKEIKYVNKKEIQLNESKEPNVMKPIETYDLTNQTTRASNQPDIKIIKNDTISTEKPNTNYVYDKNRERPDVKKEKVKLVEVDQKVNSKIRGNRIDNYDEDDVWKNTFNKDMKVSTKSTTIIFEKYTGTVTTARSDTTLRPNITVKPTNMVTTPPKIGFIPVSMPVKLSTTTKPNIKKGDNTKTQTESDVKSKLPNNNLLHFVNSFTKANANITTEYTVKKDPNRVSNATVTVATTLNIPTATKPVTQYPITNWVKDLAFTALPGLSNSNYNISQNDLFMDPFANIENGMDFLKTLK